MWWIQIASQWFVVSSSRWIRHSEDSQCLLLLHFLFQVNAAHALGNMLWLSYWPQAAFGVYLFIYLFEYWSEMSHPWACWMASLTRWMWVWWPGVGDGQGSLACWSPWGCKESDTSEWLNWTDLTSLVYVLQWAGRRGASLCSGGLSSEATVPWMLHVSDTHVPIALILQLLIPWGKAGNLPVHFNSVTQSCLTFCDPMDCSTPGLPVHHQLPNRI